MLGEFMTTTVHPFFIVSSGRSGTTLLRAVLNAHPSIHIPHESDFLVRAWPYYGTRAIDESDYVVLAKLFRIASEGDGWGWSQDEVVRILERKRPRSLEALTLALLEEHRDLLP